MKIVAKMKNPEKLAQKLVRKAEGQQRARHKRAHRKLFASRTSGRGVFA